MLQINCSNSYNQSKFTFCGLRENKILGEKVLSDFREEYGHLKSSSFIEEKIFQHTHGEEPEGIFASLTRKNERLKKKIYNKSFFYVTENVYYSEESFMKKLKWLVKRKKMANCWEDHVIISDMIAKKGERPVNFEINIIQDGEIVDKHFSTAIGLKKDAFITQPRTWGNKAVVIDALNGIVMPARDALEYFKTFFSFDPKNQTFRILNSKLEDQVRFSNVELLNRIHAKLCKFIDKFKPN